MVSEGDIVGGDRGSVVAPEQGHRVRRDAGLERRVDVLDVREVALVLHDGGALEADDGLEVPVAIPADLAKRVVCPGARARPEIVVAGNSDAISIVQPERTARHSLTRHQDRHVDDRALRPVLPRGYFDAVSADGGIVRTFGDHV